MTDTSAGEPVVAAGAGATSGRSVLGGGTWNVAGTFVPQLSLLAISIAAARFLGPSEFGRQSFIAFVEVAAITLFTAGIPLTLARFVGELIGRDRGGVARQLVQRTLVIEAVGAVLGGGLLVTIGLLGALPRAAWLLAGVVVLAAVLQRVPTALLTGLQQWRRQSLVSVWIALLVAGATIAVLAAGGGITGMFAVEAATTVISLVWLSRIAARAEVRLPSRRPLPPDVRRSVVNYTLLSSVGVLLTLVVWRRSEFLFLNHYSSDTQIALYSVAFAAVAALLVAPQAVIAAALPAVATLLGAGAIDRIHAGFGRALRLLVLVTVPLTALSIALGPLALRLVYGEGFRGAGPVVVVLLAPLPLVALSSLSSVVLAGLNRLVFPLVVGVVGAVVNIGLDFLLIPRYDAVGAAFANIGAQLVAGLPVLAYAARALRPVSWAPSFVVRAAVAAAAGGVSARLVSDLLGGVAGLLGGLAAGVAVFAFAAAVLPILSADDARWLEDASGSRVRVVRRLTRLWSPRVVEVLP
jgi:O-antigen/teichoic acid export membrane protein